MASVQFSVITPILHVLGVNSLLHYLILHLSITSSLNHPIPPSSHPSSLHHPSLHHFLPPSPHPSITQSFHHPIPPSPHPSITSYLHHLIPPSPHPSINTSVPHTTIVSNLFMAPSLLQVLPQHTYTQSITMTTTRMAMMGRVSPMEGPRHSAFRSKGDSLVTRGAVLDVRVMSVMVEVEGVATASNNREIGDWGGGMLVR